MKDSYRWLVHTVANTAKHQEYFPLYPHEWNKANTRRKPPRWERGLRRASVRANKSIWSTQSLMFDAKACRTPSQLLYEQRLPLLLPSSALSMSTADVVCCSFSLVFVDNASNLECLNFSRLECAVIDNLLVIFIGNLPQSSQRHLLFSESSQSQPLQSHRHCRW